MSQGRVVIPTNPIAAHPLAPKNGLGWRYATVYSFTQQQLARYSTVPAAGTEQREGVVIRHVGARRHDKQAKEQYWRSKDYTAEALTEYRCQRKLEKEKNRVKNLLSSLNMSRRSGSRSLLGTKRDRDLSFQGKYRSLNRRIYALRLIKDEQLNLTRDSELWPTVITKAFSALDARVYHLARGIRHRIELLHDPQIEILAGQLCDTVEASGTETMLTNWISLPEDVRSETWHLILLYLLDHRPDQALLFLRVLSQPPYIHTLDPRVLADALEHISGLCVRNPHAENYLTRVSDIIPVFTLVYNNHLFRYRGICSEDLLRHLSFLATHKDLIHLLDIVSKRKLGSYNTLLHYANLFAKFGDHENALRCLERILERASSGEDLEQLVSRKNFRWTCALILRQSVCSGQNYHLTTQIVARFLKLGLKLDILMYNVVMHNALEAGDLTTAFRIYHLLENEGMEPDSHSYSILLQGCAVCDRPADYEDFAEHCAKKATELQSGWLASGYLHFLYRLHEKDNLEDLSSILHSAYSRFFSLDSLQLLVPPLSRGEVLFEKSSNAATSKMEPTTLALYIMLQLELRKALSVGTEQVQKLYSTFRRLADEGQHPILLELAKLPVVWNAFLLAFCRRKQYATASELVKTMSESDPKRTPRPDVYTWNIFMHAFIKQQQPRAAERIYEIMRSHGVQPDECTYATLLKGHVNTQDVGKIAHIVGQMDEEQQIDPRVLRALTRVRDQKSLMHELENVKLEKEREEKSLREEEAQKEQRRWDVLGLDRRPLLGETANQTSREPRSNSNEITSSALEG
jgi:pentatricopeptide repeat protein